MPDAILSLAIKAAETVIKDHNVLVSINGSGQSLYEQAVSNGSRLERG
jgi:hypothetical protein